MVTIALVGADGAGKSTVSARLARELPVPVRCLYLGSNPESATHALPTTRIARWVRAGSGRAQRAGGPPALRTGPPPTRPTGHRRLVAGARAALRVGNQVAEESYREAIGRWHVARGRLVICDRYPTADQHAHDLAPRPGTSRSRRVHGALLRRLVAPPDLVVVLDADPAVLHARKGEGTLAELASRRAEYLDYARTVDRAVVVDVARPLDDVVHDVRHAVLDLVGTAP